MLGILSMKYCFLLFGGATLSSDCGLLLVLCSGNTLGHTISVHHQQQPTYSKTYTVTYS